MSLRGRIAIITGASSGIGAGIAEYFAKEGAILSLTGRKKENLDAVAKKCSELSSEFVLTTVGDITKRDTRETLINNTRSKFDKIDILGQGQCVYGITKAGLDTFTKVLSREMGPKGVRVNSVNPGYITSTEIVTRSNAAQSVPEGFGEKVPIVRNGISEDIAQTVAFLASDKASFITGQTLFVDSGFLLVPAF